MSPPKSNLWFAELQDVEDPMLLQEFVGDCLIDYTPEDMATVMDKELHYTVSGGSECNSSTAAAEISKNNSISNADSNQNSPVQKHSDLDPEGDRRPHSITTKPTKRPRRLPDQCQNHIMAERQRRQNLSQRFIALAALIPGLKKMDKTSVLGEAINHMKQLKDRLKDLEEETARRETESVLVIRRSRVVVDNESNPCTCNDNRPTSAFDDEQLPEVETRISNDSVLIKIHCEMRTSVLSKIINEIENYHLSVTATSSMPFNNRTLDITIMAQMEPDFDMRPQDVVANLRSIF